MDSIKDLLIELGTEDLPARLLVNLSNEFSEIICAQLTEQGLHFTSHKAFNTPRRLAVIVNNLEISQKDQIIERKGPNKTSAFDNSGMPTKAANGFARSCGVKVEQLELEKNVENPKLLFREKRVGLPTSELLPSIIEKTVNSLTFPKRMRWNDSGAQFIRPIRWLLVIFGSDIVPVSIFGNQAGNTTLGHRFHSPGRLPIKSASDYSSKLRSQGYVLADFEERQNAIVEQVTRIASQINAKPLYTKNLLDEITCLVEWPHAILGNFDKKFLNIPQEVLISTMQDKQKYIPLFNNNKLLPHFVVISNIDSSSPEIVQRGNEKVIVPRFEDASFFWQRDKNQPLYTKLEKLKSVVYEKQLGSLFDKTERIVKIVKYVGNEINADTKLCERAATLCKCDLLTEMVSEFPELQGIIGKYLALNDKEEAKVANALEEIYLPRQSGDQLPKSDVGIILAIADRIDTLVGIFAIGKKPTGLKDPYGLRRASLAILRIIIESRLDIDLLACLNFSASLLPNEIKATPIVNDVFDYVYDRLRTYFTSSEVAHDVVDSVLANKPTKPNDAAARIEALSNFRRRPDATSLSAANKRIRNILKKVDRNKIGDVNKELFKEHAENDLYDAIKELTSDVELLFQQHKYENALTRLANLRRSIDKFFDDVMVMDEDDQLRSNRIALLAQVDRLFMHVADFSRLQS